MSKIWTNPQSQQLVEVFASMSNKTDIQNFLRDVMTEKEIIEISARLEAARLLSEGEKYMNITNQTKLSSRTVARISEWLKNGCSGYQIALTTLKDRHTHTSPVRAE